jgi:hypothetical protein
VAPSTTAAPDGDEAAVLATVDCYWSTILAANDPPDPNHPGFAECFTGPALERSTTLTEVHRARGERVTDSTGRTEQYRVEVVFDDASRARVSECIIDDAVVVEAGSGRVVDDKVISADMVVHVVRDPDRWRVADVDMVRDALGEELCR